MGLLDTIRSLFTGRGRGSEDADEGDPIEVADRAIAAFWTWWAQTQAQLQATVASGMTPRLIDELSRKVEAIHPELGWEFSKGTHSRHALAVTGGGNPQLRLLAERWRALGPGDDEVWAFHATKPALAADAVATTQLGMGDATFDFADVRVGVEEDPSRGVLDVVFWHPVFRTAPEEVRGQLTFITLDSVLGEDAVERWLGGIDMATEPVVDGVDLVTLRARVDALAERDQEGAWIVGEGPDADTGLACVYALDRSVRRWDHPLCDTFVRVVLPYAANEGGMPADPELMDVLSALEEDLQRAIGPGGVHLGRRTGAGSRILFFYLDGRDDLPDRVRAWAAQCPRPCEVHLERDPLWQLRPG